MVDIICPPPPVEIGLSYLSKSGGAIAPDPTALDGDLSRFQIGMSTSFSHQVENCWHHSGFISLVPDWNFLNLQSQCKEIMSIFFPKICSYEITRYINDSYLKVS